MQGRRRRRLLFEEAGFIPPDPPEPPTAYDRIIPEADGLVNYETAFNTVVPGGVIIGIGGKNNANAPVDFTVTIDDEPVLVLSSSSLPSTNSAFTYLGVVEDLPIGAHVIKIVSNGASSSGMAGLRIVETDPMPVGWQGVSKENSGTGPVGGVTINMTGTTPGSLVISVAAWNDRRAYAPVCQDYPTRLPQQTVRTDLIENAVTLGFFRSTVTSDRCYLLFKSFQTAYNSSMCMAELKGVTIRT